MKLYKLTTITLLVLTLVRGFETAAQDKHWLSYEPEVIELEGRVIVEWKFGPPNHGENPKTDARVRVPILVLRNPVNVRGNPQDKLNSESVVGIKRIQIRFFSLKTSYRQFIGKRVLVTGTLSHAITGHDYTKVVMDLRSIKVKKGRT